MKNENPNRFESGLVRWPSSTYNGLSHK